MNRAKFQEFKQVVDYLLPDIPAFDTRQWYKYSKVNRIVQYRKYQKAFYTSLGVALYDQITKRNISKAMLSDTDCIFIQKIVNEYELLDERSGLGARCYNYFTKEVRKRQHNLRLIRGYVRGLTIFGD